MAKLGRLAHFGIGDSDPWARIAGTGYRYASAGENVGWNEPDTEATVAAWMGSPGHRANILGPYSGMGAAMAVGANGPYRCVDFAAPAPGPA